MVAVAVPRTKRGSNPNLMMLDEAVALTVAVRAVAGPLSRPVPRSSRLGGTVHTGNLFPSRASCREGRCRPVLAHSLVPLSSPISVRATSIGEEGPPRQWIRAARCRKIHRR